MEESNGQSNKESNSGITLSLADEEAKSFGQMWQILEISNEKI